MLEDVRCFEVWSRSFNCYARLMNVLLSIIIGFLFVGAGIYWIRKIRGKKSSTYNELHSFINDWAVGLFMLLLGLLFILNLVV